MAILTRATEKNQAEWREVAEGMWRFRIGKPALKQNPRDGKHRARFPLMLTLEEQKRHDEMIGPPPPGVNQSYRVNYSVGLSLGFFREGQYQTTMLIDFLCAAMGTENGKKFRKWIEAGNGPPRPADKDDSVAELAMIETWLGWWEDLEVYGTVTQSGQWTNFAGPMAVGSLPGQPEPDYQAHCRGKLRQMMTEVAQVEPMNPPSNTAAAIKEEVAKARQTVAAPAVPADEDEDDQELPF